MVAAIESITPVLIFVWKVARWAIPVGAVFIIPHRRPPAQARAWLFFFLLVPVVALVCYSVFGRI